MCKLLHAGFSRLWKNFLFWFGILYMIVRAFYNTTDILNAVKAGYGATLSNVFFYYTRYILILEALFVSLTIGTEYSDKTIRNKIIMGYRRQTMYLSYLFVSLVAGLLMCLSHLAVSMIGISLGFSVSVPKTLLGVLCSFALVCGLAAIYTMITLLCKNRTTAIILCLVLSFALLYYAYGIRDTVNLARQAGRTDVWNEILYAILPGCQAVQLSLDPEMAYSTNPFLLIACSFLLFFTTTAFGLFRFRKTDIN